MRLLIIAIVLVVCLKSTAQEITKNNENICKEVENTYQVIVSSSRLKYAITDDVCKIVKRERKKDKTIIYQVNEFYALKIYSETEIPTLKKPLEYIIYKEK